MLTVEQLAEALWQAYYHMEFSELITQDAIGLDGNDHPVFRELAEKLLRRIQDVTAI